MGDVRPKKRRRKQRTTGEPEGSDDNASDSLRLNEKGTNNPELSPDETKQYPSTSDPYSMQRDEAAERKTTRVLPPLFRIEGQNVDNDDFSRLYMDTLTEEFSADLDKLRKSKDFTEPSLPLLVKALKEGVNIFSDSQRQAVLEKARQQNQQNES